MQEQLPEAMLTSMKYLSALFLIFFSLGLPVIVIAQERPNYSGFYDGIRSMVAADSSSKLHVVSITVSGNKKTKTYIILREIRFKAGDSVSASRLYEILEQSRDLIYNTNLFSEVAVIPLITTGSDISINVIVKEKWYIYPTPQFKLVDRNLNEWINTYNADLNRVIYGAKFAHYNLSGRGDQLRIYLLSGYARTIAASYTAPYSNSALTEGFSVSGGYTQSREVQYKTSYDNKLLLFKADGFARNTLSLAASYQLRRGYFRKHIFSLGYNYADISDSIIDPKYNPTYFNGDKAYASYPEMSYTFQYTNTDNINYPLKGKIFGGTILKRGLGLTGGINSVNIEARYSRYIPHSRNWNSSFQFNANVKAPFKTAYINQKAFGYSDLYLRGLEYYVIDGVLSTLAKYTIKKKIISFNIPVPFHIKALPSIPFTIFAKTYADAGYVYNRKELDTRLNNRFLYSTGFGIDILTLYDLNFKLEYSFNQLGENGLFLHAKGGF